MSSLSSAQSSYERSGNIVNTDCCQALQETYYFSLQYTPYVNKVALLAVVRAVLFGVGGGVVFRDRTSAAEGARLVEETQEGSVGDNSSLNQKQGDAALRTRYLLSRRDQRGQRRLLDRKRQPQQQPGMKARRYGSSYKILARQKSSPQQAASSGSSHKMLAQWKSSS